MHPSLAMQNNIVSVTRFIFIFIFILLNVIDIIVCPAIITE